MTEREAVDAATILATSRMLVAAASEACSGDVSTIIPALTGAIITAAGCRGVKAQDEILQIAIESLEAARGLIGVSVRTIVLSGGQPS